MPWIKEHFDHLLLAILAVIGAGAGLWASVHGLEKMSEWFTLQASGCIAALLMRMQGSKGGPPGPLAPA